ncbi:MAG TPA: hypothetical protein VGQ81_10325, partial [Acidobacteriota bacterium]|nr:hypothetical protein [Acidobacteriota bacterium]
MPLKVVYTGDLPSLEVRFLESLKTDRRDNPLHPGVVLSSSHLLGTHLRRQAIRAGNSLFNVRFHTFDTVSADLLPLDYRKRKLISPLGELSLLRKIVRSHPGYFEPVQDKSGFGFALLATVRDLIDAGIEEIPGRIQKTGKLKDIALILQSYRKEIAPFISRSRALELAAHNIDQFAAVYGTSSLTVYGFYDFTRLQREFLSAAVEKLSITAFLTYQSGEAYAFAEAALHFFQQLGFQHTPLHKQGLPAPESGSTCRDLELLHSRIFQPAQKASEKTAASKNQNPTPELRSVFQAAGRGRRKQFQDPAQGSLFDTLQSEPASDTQFQLSVPVSTEATHSTLEVRNSKFEIRDPSSDTRDPTPDGTVTLISAADEPAEITEICHEIQNCARNGIDFSEMAVLLRNPETYVPLVIDTFTANGVPYYIQSALPLSETHQAKSLLLFL